MEYNPQEVYNALNLVKEICISFQNCNDCPFSKNGDCVVSNEGYCPNEWELNSPQNWVAFR